MESLFMNNIEKLHTAIIILMAFENYLPNLEAYSFNCLPDEFNIRFESGNSFYYSFEDKVFTYQDVLNSEIELKTEIVSIIKML